MNVLGKLWSKKSWKLEAINVWGCDAYRATGEWVWLKDWLKEEWEEDKGKYIRWNSDGKMRENNWWGVFKWMTTVIT